MRRKDNRLLLFLFPVLLIFLITNSCTDISATIEDDLREKFPDIAIMVDEQPILPGNLVDFGGIALSTAQEGVTKTFFISNTGEADLNLNAPGFMIPTDHFEIISGLMNPILKPGESTSFSIIFDPQGSTLGENRR